MEPISIIFASATAGKSIAEYLGLVESIHSDIKALLHQSFNGAKMNLECAKSATGTNQIDYIKQAKNQFINAIGVEKGANLVTSYLGLAMCQFLLGDITNARTSLECIRTVEIPKGERNKAAVADIILPDNILDWIWPIFGPLRKGTNRLFGGKGFFELSAEQKLERYKTECLKCLDLKQLNKQTFRLDSYGNQRKKSC